jgi:hypothetical protein
MRRAIIFAILSVFVIAPPVLAADGLLGGLFGGGKPDVPQTIWQRANDGTATHLQSELQCPPAAGPFRLTAVTVFDGFGFDVGCQYDNTRRDRITLYLTNLRGQSLQAYFEGDVAEMLKSAPDAKPAGEGNVQFTTDSGWLASLHEIGGGKGRTGLWLTDMSGWEFQYRATYAAAEQDTVFAAMAELAAVGAKTAGAHLAACAAAPTLERGGRRITDERQLITLTLTATGMAYPPLRGPAAPTAIDPVWCAVDGLSVDGVPFLHWRNLADQNGGVIERITAMAGRDRKQIICVADVVGTKQFPNDLRSVYDIAFDGEDRLDLLGIYEGMPALEEVARFAADRRFLLFSSTDKKNRKTSIYRTPPPLPPLSTIPAPASP